MARILTFRLPFTGSAPHPYEDDSRIFTPESMDEFDAELRPTAVAALAA